MAAEARFVISADDRSKIAVASAKANLKSLSGAALKLGGVVAGVAGVGGLGLLVKSQIDLQDQTVKLADRLGSTTEEISRLQFIAGQTSEITREGLNKGLEDLTRRLQEAKDKGGPLADVLDQVGLSADELADTGAVEAFEEISRAMRETEDPGIRARLAYESMGKAGKLLQNTMLTTAEDMDALAAAADNLGIVISDESARQAVQFNDDLDVLKNSVVGTAQAMTNDMLPALTSISGAMADAAKEGGFLEGVIAGINESINQLITGTEEQELLNQIEVAGEAILRTQERIADATGANGMLAQALEGDQPGKIVSLFNDLDTLTASVENLQKQLFLLRNPQDEGGEGTDEGAVKLPISGMTPDELKAQAQWERDTVAAILDSGVDDFSIAERHKTKVAAREAALRQQQQANFFSLASSLMSSESRAAFEAGKLLATSNAVIKGKEAVVGAYAFGSNIGGPVLGGTFAGVAALAVASQIQAIQSQQFGGGGSVGSTGGGGGGAAGVGAGSALALPDAQERAPQTSTQVIIMTDGDGEISDEKAERMMHRFRELSAEKNIPILPEGGTDMGNIARL
jgi:hypothetical protein